MSTAWTLPALSGDRSSVGPEAPPRSGFQTQRAGHPIKTQCCFYNYTRGCLLHHFPSWLTLSVTEAKLLARAGGRTTSTGSEETPGADLQPVGVSAAGVAGPG